MYEQLARDFFTNKLNQKRNRPKIAAIDEKYNAGEAGVIFYLTFIKDGATPGELSEHYQVSTARIASILNSLEKKNSIKRVVDSNDKRRVIVYINNTVKEETVKNVSASLKQLTLVFEQMGEQDSKELIRLTTKMQKIIDKMNNKEDIC